MRYQHLRNTFSTEAQIFSFISKSLLLIFFDNIRKGEHFHENSLLAPPYEYFEILYKISRNLCLFYIQ